MCHLPTSIITATATVVPNLSYFFQYMNTIHEIGMSSVNLEEASLEDLVRERNVRETRIDAMTDRMDTIEVLMQTYRCEKDSLERSLNEEQTEYERIRMELSERGIPV